MKVRLTADEKHLLYCALDELCRMPYRELNRHFGSLTIQDIQKLHHKMHYDGYCRKHGIRLKDMTDYDYIRAYEEEEEEKQKYAYDPEDYDF